MPLSASVVIAAIYAGVQAVFAAGVHTDTAGAQHGVAPAALIEIGTVGTRFGFRIEGIPPVSVPQKPSAFYGAATPQVSLINGNLRYAIDPAMHVYAGLGETVINQRTPLPNLQQVVGSRLAGLRYELLYRVPLPRSRFFEAFVGGAPHLTGADLYTYSLFRRVVVKPETAAEIDAEIAWGVQFRNAEVLFGARTINFAARYTSTGLAADRNNGAGIMAEWRQFLRR